MNRLQTWIARMTGIEPESRNWEVVVEARRANHESAAGTVTPESALRLSAVFACVRVLSETMASLPLMMYETAADGSRRPASDHPLYRVLRDPNPFMTGFDYIEVLMKHLALRGNAYSQIDYDDRGRITELWPLPPQNFISSRIEAGQRLYEYQDETGRTTWMSSDIVWHVHCLGDGLTGYSPIGLQRRAVALGLSAEEFGQRFFENDARPGIVLEHPGKLDDQAHKRLASSWEDTHRGLSKSHRAAILEEGMKLHEVGIPPEDAQFLETRKFQVSEIARIYRVPPHMIADLDRSTNNNIEHQGIEFGKFTILPWVERFEQSIGKYLLLKRDSRYLVEFLMAGLERGDIQSRYGAYSIGRQGGWLSANDIRRLENMEPIEGGDVYLVPLNMTPADQAGAAPSPPAPPDTARSLAPGREERSLGSARARHRLAAAQRGVILDVAERAMRRETHDVGEAVRKYMGRRDSGQLLIWLDEFYRGHADWLKAAYLPVFRAYAELVAAEALDEVEAEDDLSERLERFVTSYTGSFGAQQAGISLYRLKEVLQAALNDGADPQEALDGELEAWRDARPAEIADEQRTRAGNAVARMIYAAAGVKTLRWVTMGDSCPYCNGLNGKVVEISKNFLTPGQELTPEGHSPLTTTTNIGHPPVHKGCDCMVAAG